VTLGQFRYYYMMMHGSANVKHSTLFPVILRWHLQL